MAKQVFDISKGESPSEEEIQLFSRLGASATPDLGEREEWVERFMARVGKDLLDILRRGLTDAEDPELSARERNTALLAAVRACRGLLGLPSWESSSEVVAE